MTSVHCYPMIWSYIIYYVLILMLIEEQFMELSYHALIKLLMIQCYNLNSVNVLTHSVTIVTVNVVQIMKDNLLYRS